MMPELTRAQAFEYAQERANALRVPVGIWQQGNGYLVRIHGNDPAPCVKVATVQPETVDDRPEPGKVYRLTGGPGVRCIANGDRWADSVCPDETAPDVAP